MWRAECVEIVANRDEFRPRPVFRRVLIANRGEVAVRLVRPPRARDRGGRRLLDRRPGLAASGWRMDRRSDFRRPPTTSAFPRSWPRPRQLGAKPCTPAGGSSRSGQICGGVRGQRPRLRGPQAGVDPNHGRHKVCAKQAAADAGLPLIRARTGPPAEEVRALTDEVGFPTPQASAGEGGRGMRLVTDPEDLGRRS